MEEKMKILSKEEVVQLIESSTSQLNELSKMLPFFRNNEPIVVGVADKPEEKVLTENEKVIASVCSQPLTINYLKILTVDGTIKKNQLLVGELNSALMGKYKDSFYFEIKDKSEVVDYCIGSLKEKSNSIDATGTSLEFSRDALIVTLAIVQFKRRIKWMSLIEHDYEVQVPTVDYLYAELSDGFSSGDTRWALPFVLSFYNPGEDINIEQGVMELEKGGFINVSEGIISLDESFDYFVGELESYEVMMGGKAIYYEDENNYSDTVIIIIRTRNSLFLIQPDAEIALITSIDFELAETVLENLVMPGAPSKLQEVEVIVADEPIVNEVIDSRVNNPIETMSNRPIESMSSNQEEIDLKEAEQQSGDQRLPKSTMNRFCTQCGTTLSKDSSFCTECGHPVEVVEVPEVIDYKYCINCGTKNPIDNAFCIECGLNI